MRYVCFVVPDLDFAGHARQVSLVASGLSRAGWAVGVHSLAGDGPLGPTICAAGIPVERPTGAAANAHRSWFVLRRAIPYPDRGVVHAFGLRVLRRLAVATLGSKRPRIILSLTGRERLSWFDRRCLRVVSRILVPHDEASDALTRRGVGSAHISVVPYAVSPAPPPADRTDLCRTHGLPSTAKLIVTAGRMDARNDLFDAVWGFEFLRYVDTDVRLLVIGDGPERDRLERNARALAPDGSRVHFLGGRIDVPALFAAADLVLVPHRTGGVNVALEAMAAARPIVAADTVDLRTLICDGETGLLVPAGKPPEVARALQRLLVDADWRCRLGTSARKYALDQHSVEKVVSVLEPMYWS
jgi:glycosyltransferase involved in cell wall biosynthesis